MLLYFALGCLAFITMATSRELSRPMPTITNSLVNLGKMEVSFYFNGSPALQPDHPVRTNTPFYSQNIRPEPAGDERCPCSNIRNIKDSFLSNPSGLLKKILMHNDLFSFNKEPSTSTLCCESHEQGQESTIVLELPGNVKNVKPFASRSNTLPIPSNILPISNNGMPLPLVPFLFDSVIPNKSMLSPLKAKSIEIFLFPKKKDLASEAKKLPPNKKDLTSKDNIQIVGDKELKNDIHLFKPALPVVKKDLDLQEKKEIQKEQKKMVKEKENRKEEIVKEGVEIILEPGRKPNAL